MKFEKFEADGNVYVPVCKEKEYSLFFSRRHTLVAILGMTVATYLLMISGGVSTSPKHMTHGSLPKRMMSTKSFLPFLMSAKKALSSKPI